MWGDSKYSLFLVAGLMANVLSNLSLLIMHTKKVNVHYIQLCSELVCLGTNREEIKPKATSIVFILNGALLPIIIAVDQ